MITTYVARPAAALKAFIMQYTLRDIDTVGHELLKPIWATDESCLTFWLRKTPIQYALSNGAQAIDMAARHIHGVQAQYTGHLVLSGSYYFLGVEFSATGFYSIFGVPMKHLKDKLLPIDEVMGIDLGSLEEQLAEARTLPAMKVILDRFFLSRLTKRKPATSEPRIAAAYTLMREQGLMDIPALAHRVNMSLRSFEHHFDEQVGLAPITAVRIRRFHQALSLKFRKPTENWTSIAHTCGYYDQNHFIKDFRSFAGDSPRTFFKNLPPPNEQVIQLG